MTLLLWLGIGGVEAGVPTTSGMILPTLVGRARSQQPLLVGRIQIQQPPLKGGGGRP